MLYQVRWISYSLSLRMERNEAISSILEIAAIASLRSP